ncbi:MAG: hypothetical protein ACJATT_003583 [Myxococcota bacterium]|jgi:hypothetical protein
MTDELKRGPVEGERRWLLRELPSMEWERSVTCVNRYPAGVVHKQTYVIGDWRVDVFGGPLEGLIIAVRQCDGAEELAQQQPPFPVFRDVTLDPLFSEAILAKRAAPPLEALTIGWLSAPEFAEARQSLAELPGSVEHACAWMVVLHRYQTPRHDGRPYLSHPAEVAQRVAQWGGDNDQISAALLHDSLEDQAERMAPGGDAAAALKTHMGPEVCRLVQALTHPSGAEGYLAYIQSLPPRALDIKVADLSTNALRVQHVHDDARRDYLTRKYASTMCWLVGRLDGHPAQPSFQTAVDDIFSAVNS